MPMPGQLADFWESVSVSICHADIYPCDSDWHIEPISPPYDDFFFIWKGHGWLEREGQRLDAQPGDLFIWRAGRRYTMGHDPARAFTVLSTGFNLRGAGGVDVLRRFALPDRLRLPPACRQAITSPFVNHICQYQNEGGHGKLAARGVLLRMVAQTLQWVQELPADCKSKAVGALPGEETRAAAVLAYINKNLKGRVTLQALARVAHLSPVYFAAMFRRHTGQSPMAYVRRRRMEAACSLLANGDGAVEQVARSVGYEDPFHFSRIFSRVIGLSPSAYRAALKNPFAR